jgi:hypothetical protein
MTIQNNELGIKCNQYPTVLPWISIFAVHSIWLFSTACRHQNIEWFDGFEIKSSLPDDTEAE